MKNCCFKNIAKAKRIGRANYICPVCGDDVSLLYFLYSLVINNK